MIGFMQWHHHLIDGFRLISPTKIRRYLGHNENRDHRIVTLYDASSTKILSSPRSEHATISDHDMYSTTNKNPGTAILEKPWEELGFTYYPTNSYIRMTYQEGTEWSQPELVKEPYLQLHIGATVLHYGQSCLEGLKAFCHENDEVYLFRPHDHAIRMQESCQRICMPSLSTEMFLEACQMVVQDNIEYVPPYGTNGSLYLRPILFGSGPRIGVQPSNEYTFIIMVTPVSQYYDHHNHHNTVVRGMIMDQYDRAAPRGVGHVKVGGNYAADLFPNTLWKQKGYPIVLYLDSLTQTYIEEFSTSNFVGIYRGTNTYITPKSSSILTSVTNRSLMKIASDVFHMNIEVRPIPVNELSEMDEVFAVGTGVVLTPIHSISRMNLQDNSIFPLFERSQQHPTNDNDDDTIAHKLQQHILDIQYGHIPDKYQWLVRC